MTKQEEIKEVIAAYANDECLYPDEYCEFRHLYCVSEEDAYKCLMKRLDGIGVVIKTDRELPSVFRANEHVMSASAYKKKLEGFTAFEPLIKEV